MWVEKKVEHWVE
jgi:hypothetical protein